MDKLLTMLIAQPQQWHHTDAVCTKLGINLEELTRRRTLLQQHGFHWHQHPHLGFKLDTTRLPMHPDILENPAARRVGRRVIVYDSTASTNDAAWHYEHEPHSDGLTVFAEHQHQGRGRLGRPWQAAKGSSILSSILLHHTPIDAGPALTLLVGLAAALAIEQTCSLTTQIKWPNDVLVNGQKLAGTMVETRRHKNQQSSVLGIGINCLQQPTDFPSELADKATSLAMLTGTTVNRVALAQALLHQLDHWLIDIENHRYHQLHQQWLLRCNDIGKRITLICDNKEFTGAVIDVDPQHGILLRPDNGAVQFFQAATTTVKKE